MAVSDRASFLAHRNIKARTSRCGLLVRNGRAFAGFPDPPECANILRGDIDIAQTWDPTPCLPSSGHRVLPGKQALSVMCSCRPIPPRRKWARIEDAAVLFDRFRAGRGVLRRRICCAHRSCGGYATRASGGGFTGNGCVGNACLARHVALGNRTFFHAEDRLAGLTIEDVDVARLRRHCQGRNRHPPLMMSSRPGGAGGSASQRS